MSLSYDHPIIDHYNVSPLIVIDITTDENETEDYFYNVKSGQKPL